MTVADDLEWVLRRRMRDSGLNQLDIAKLAGKSRAWTGAQFLAEPETTIWQMYQKDPDALDRLAKGMEWRDKFDMMIDLKIITRSEIKAFDQALREMLASAGQSPDEVQPSTRVRIPVYALASAGSGVWTEERIVTHIEVEPEIAHRHNRVTLRVDGDSMEPTLESGDFIHLDPNDKDIVNDKIYVVMILGNGVVVKRARVYETGVYLVSDNSAKYPPLAQSEARILGRVFAVTPQTRKL